jgi:hypothetical protein
MVISQTDLLVFSTPQLQSSHLSNTESSWVETLNDKVTLHALVMSKDKKAAVGVSCMAEVGVVLTFKDGAYYSKNDPVAYRVDDHDSVELKSWISG